MRGFIKERSFYLMLCLLYSFCALRVTLWLSGISTHTVIVTLFVLVWVVIIDVSEYHRFGWIPAALTAIAIIAAAYTLETAVIEPFLGGAAAKELSISNDIAVMLFMAILCLVFNVISKSSVLRMITAVCWVIFWIVCIFVPLSLPKTAIVLMLPAVLYELARAVFVTFKGNDKEHFDTLCSQLMAFFIVGSLIMFVMPTSAEPYHWKVPRAILNTVYELYEKIETVFVVKTSGGSEYSMSFNGISEGTELLGRRRKNSAGVMEITTETRPVGRVYLRGNTWEIYDGSSWSTQLAGQDDMLLSVCNDTVEHAYALWRYEGDRELTDFFRKNSVDITYKNTKTRTMFSSSNTCTIVTDSDKYPWHYTSNGLVFDYIQDDASYTINYLEENSRAIGDLITASEDWVYGEHNLKTHWFTISADLVGYFRITTRGFSYIEEFLQERQELIYNTYLDVPDFVSDEVYELADSITEGLTTDYEKVLAIESYLRGNYTYTTTPETPKGGNFLDWFLFEADEGYCTWLATAASILARCEGIPSRYVQGYCTSLKEGESHIVTGEDAHAWSECYISGYGWVTVEATPGYSAGGYGTWLTASDLAAVSGDGEDEWEEEELSVGFGGLTYDTDEQEPEKQMKPETKPEEDSKQTNYFAIAVCLLVIAALLAGAMLYDKYVLTAKRRYEAASFSERAEFDLERIVMLSKKTGCLRRNDESINEFLVRLSRYIGADTSRVRHIAEIYERVFFGGIELEEKEWLESRWLLECVEKKLRERIYFWRN